MANGEPDARTATDSSNAISTCARHLAHPADCNTRKVTSKQRDEDLSRRANGVAIQMGEKQFIKAAYHAERQLAPLDACAAQSKDQSVGGFPPIDGRSRLPARSLAAIPVAWIVTARRATYVGTCEEVAFARNTARNTSIVHGENAGRFALPQQHWREDRLSYWKVKV